MDIRQFPSVHWIWRGGISFVCEVHPCIVVKVPKSEEFEGEQFDKELEIYWIFSRSPPCPSIVQYFLFSGNGIFLEYMRDVLIDRNRLKLSDFDYKAKIGTNYEAYIALYGKILNSNEAVNLELSVSSALE
ncbi:hypothetical protein N7517_009530 [Penicillium concentricum]|uniref:Protein kinase domain-containing protein n=1 Tax=Penicillium concentricum TaxID=293559 RepID=A0A9W9UXJ1_9EURO|nr:uncharacterized protein N7517_009530 [Penicillium concentricum]KAJ5360339.1 hypothetical protein N7517_009530 [Penicillium concentricum]